MKHLKKSIVVLVLALCLVCFVACQDADKGNNAQGDEGVKFELWNECEALRLFKEYVAAVTTDPTSRDFIPVEDRIAVFDMDGTLCGELFPEYIEYLLLEYRVLDDPTFETDDEEVLMAANAIRESGRQYKTPDIADFDQVHGRSQAKAFAGMTSNEFIAYVRDFLDRPAQGFEGLTYANSIYKPMIEIVKCLQQNDFTVYVVSGSDRMICRAVACEALGIPANQVIGMDVTMHASHQPDDKDNLHYQFNDSGEDTLVRGDEMWIKNLKMNKVFQIAQEIGKQPVLSFGNSSGDVSMHEYTVSNNPYRAMAFMLVADDTLRDHADMTETNKRIAKWEQYGYTIISMRDDFKTIYGEGVRKLDEE